MSGLLFLMGEEDGGMVNRMLRAPGKISLVSALRGHDGRVVSKPWTHFPSCSRRMAPSFDSHSLWWRQKGLRLPALPSSTFHWEKEHRVINGIGTGTFRRKDSLQESHNAHIFLILTIRELEAPNYFAASQNPTSMVLKAFVCLKDP